MIKASIDRPKLERSLKRFAKEFGDTNATAIARWGVQSCREAALETLPWKTKGSDSAKKQQQAAIQKDIGRVCNVQETVSRARRKAGGERLLQSPADVIAWMDQNRAENHRTRKLPPAQKKTVSRTVFTATVRLLMKHAGIAKGGFIGAGMEIAKAQKGANRIAIGKNFLSYAQKHSAFGSATRPRPGFATSATLKNRAAHTGSAYVLKKSGLKRAIEFGLKKTVQWYSRAVSAQNKKQKP